MGPNERAGTSGRKTGSFDGSEVLRAAADAHDAAREYHVQPTTRGLGQERVALGSGVEPDLRDALLLELPEERLTDFGRHIHGGHVDGTGDLQHRAIRRQSFDHVMTRVDRHHVIALGTKGTNRSVTVLPSID